jgi:sugar lactone lactonase YvrE
VDRHAALIAAGVTAALACGCAARGPAAEVRAALAQDPRSPSLLYLDAAFSGARDRARALAELAALDGAGWDNPLADDDFTPLARDPGYAGVAARIAARARPVARAQVAAVVATPDLFPEGIAVDARAGTLYLSSLWQRRIVRIGADGASATFADAGAGLYAVLGLHVDAARRLLWAASDANANLPGLRHDERGRAELIAFDLQSGRVVTRAVAPGPGPHLLNDMSIASDGTVYVTDSEGGGVFALAPGAAALVPFVGAGALSYPNGIVVDGARVLVAHAWGIAVAPRDGAPLHALPAPPAAALGGIDGLALAGDALYAVQNGLGRARVVRFALDGTHARVTGMTVLENQHAALALPTTLAVDETRRALFIVADSHIDQLGPKGPRPGTRPSSTILTLPLDD